MRKCATKHGAKSITNKTKNSFLLIYIFYTDDLEKEFGEVVRKSLIKKYLSNEKNNVKILQ